MSSGSARALDPLLALAGGVFAAAALARFATTAGIPAAVPVLLALGIAAGLLAARRPPGRGAVVLWLAAGLALGSGRALRTRTGELDTAHRLAGLSGAAVRVEAEVREGWLATRWGARTRVRIRAARQHGSPLDLPETLGLEVRNTTPATALPGPGSRIRVLASVRGPAGTPFLVAASPRLVEQLRPPRGVAHLRQGVADALLRAAGTDPRRIRAAELAAVLSVGRKDLLPRPVRDSWRRSGLAHVLAVSGLHVGLVAGLVWLAAVAAGATPNRARFVVLLAVPGYALLAGASPSALRAAGMVVVYVGARLLGRAPLPMAAVILTACVLLLARPGLVADPSFQLTVGVTAALVRWVPPLTALLPLPRWLAGTVAVPLVAQAAAAPLVAWHFRSLLPGAVLTNLAVPLLLAPTLVAALGAAAAAALWPPAAVPFLEVLGRLASLVLAAGGAARSHALVVPAIPGVLLLALLAAGALALLERRTAPWAAAAWCLLVVLGSAWWAWAPNAELRGPLLLPVRVGLAALVPAPEGPVLVDGGRSPVEGSLLLADAGVRRLGAVVATHADEDHVGGLPRVVEAFRPRMVLLPSGTASRPGAVPLLRAARRRNVPVVVLARGFVTTAAGARLETLWPPADPGGLADNDRSLVARIGTRGGGVLLTSDVSSAVERSLLASPGLLRSGVLVVAHHGSRSSTTPAFLDAVAPHVALVPAGPGNTHHHPNPRVLDRLRAAGIPWRAPIFHGPCGAEWRDGRWRPFP